MATGRMLCRKAARCALGLTIGGLLIAASSEAQAQQLRYSKTAPGGITATGNTLGLSKAFSANGPGDRDSIGTFISVDPTSVDDFPANPSNPWFAGTTSDWTQNSSTGDLDIPANAEILYAELVWAGSYRYNSEDVTASLDTPVTLRHGGQAIQVSPDPASALTIAEMSYLNFEANYYLRSADVTAFVAQQLGGTYSVAGVPATQDTAINSLNAAGWTLVVAYRDDEAPIRNLSIFVGGSFVDEDSQQDYTVDGFCAPQSGPVEGSVVVSALEGDANLTGDTLLIGETSSSTFANLSGPNNPETNFFCSQVNNGAGNIDTRGSFGDDNHDAFAGTNIVGGRQGWDLTTIPLSSTKGHLVNGQTSAVVRTNTTGDSFVPTLVALELDVKSPDFSNSSGLQSSVTSVELGDAITITAVLDNSGEAPATNLRFVMPLDTSLALTDYTTDGVSGDIGGQAVTKADLLNGVDAGTLDPGSQREVKVVLDVTGAPSAGDVFVFSATWQHSFQVCDNDPPIMNSWSPNGVTVDWDAPDSGAGGSGGSGTGGTGATGGSGGTAASGGSGGDAGAAGAAGTGAGGPVDSGVGGTGGAAGSSGGTIVGDNPDAGSDGGCACTTPSSRHPATSFAWLAALALVVSRSLRRRR